jgi:hypothetical protein
MLTGYWTTQALYVAAKLGIADLLAQGPLSAEDLAAATHVHAPSLYRMLRALASVGVFAEVAPQQFALTPLAVPLRTATPETEVGSASLRALCVLYGEVFYPAWGDLLHSVRTGEPAFEHQLGMGVFEYLVHNAEAGKVFDEAMGGRAHRIASAVVGRYDFSPFATVVDVGGGQGTLLAAILRSTRATRGILFDLPQVVVGAEVFLRTAGVADRCTCSGGDFFAGVPSGGDAYVLTRILHDWDDERCVAILQQVRQAIPDHGKLLIIEDVLPPAGNEPNFGKWMDLQMLVLLRGRERTPAEYKALLGAATFELAGVIPTLAGPSIVEAIPVNAR